MCAEWDGGLVLVSHDFRLIGQVATEIWEVKGGAVTRWPADILSYKEVRVSASLPALACCIPLISYVCPCTMQHLRATHEALVKGF